MVRTSSVMEKSFMADKYECKSCKRTAVVKDGKPAPECCGKPMKHLPKEICLQPGNAESQRPMEDEEPCNDFRSGN